jgi:hypothetical protein
MDLTSGTAIYQYKQSLPEWIVNRNTTAEANIRASGEISLGVEILRKIALEIEASKRSKMPEKELK